MAKKNPHAVALGRLGGQKSGLGRMAKLSPERRQAIARLAAQARWYGCYCAACGKPFDMQAENWDFSPEPDDRPYHLACMPRLGVVRAVDPESL